MPAIQIINDLINAIKKNENTTESNWILGGASNGGKAAFKFAKIIPQLFTGIIVIPGSLTFKEIPKEWINYKILLAVGDQEGDDWKDEVDITYKYLNNKVKTLIKYIMKGQGHIVMPSYNIGQVYDKYFQ